MSSQNNKIGSDDTLRPQVVVMDTPQKSGAGLTQPLAPRIIATRQNRPYHPGTYGRAPVHSRTGPAALQLADEACSGGSGCRLQRLARR